MLLLNSGNLTRQKVVEPETWRRLVVHALGSANDLKENDFPALQPSLQVYYPENRAPFFEQKQHLPSNGIFRGKLAVLRGSSELTYSREGIISWVPCRVDRNSIKSTEVHILRKKSQQTSPNRIESRIDFVSWKVGPVWRRLWARLAYGMEFLDLENGCLNDLDMDLFFFGVMFRRREYHGMKITIKR